MMNTKLYKVVLNLAGELVDAAQRKDQKRFDRLYSQLNTLCLENENTPKDHPVQWETLADFTDEFADAVTLYEKALVKATAINAKDYMSSISYSLATMHIELGQTDAAITALENAKISANKIADKELKSEIDELLNDLKR
ncbi:tetratricopeptide repeat protein [Pseudoalteromonas shioyasakiensis]|uniref:tetratricopeptide repeat protein n=1 Tax=Pseudoalteromonas shioyasakiensis TaxID=1190813 RepID=UPI002118DA09|nr:tetratricopeptide repeat protein [Pseudoalteromonas shioyasakiensis]MCQ8877440.1 tetratricopeptide repeat protein [Pseudoalteromonas shioyasakiensis]